MVVLYSFFTDFVHKIKFKKKLVQISDEIIILKKVSVDTI